METVLVAEAAGRRVDWETVTDIIRNPMARVIACDPIALKRARQIRENVFPTSALLTPEELAEIDRRIAIRLDACRRVGTVDSATGLNVAFLAARTIAFQLVGSEKAVAVAAKLIPSSDRFVLVGDSRPGIGHAYPSECQDLFDILAAWTRSVGIACERIATSGEPIASNRRRPDVGPKLAAVAERLWRLRPRRVLAVRLYGDLRPRLSRLLPGAAVLPLMVPNRPSRVDTRMAGDLANAFSAHLENEDHIPSTVRTVTVDRLRAAVAQDLPLAFARTRSASRALKRFKPQVVLQMEDISPWGRALASLARASGAWSLVVQHGLTGEDLYGINVMPAVANCHACWGEESRQWNVDHGAPRDSQIVIGNPMFDRYFQAGQSMSRPTEPPREVAYVSQPFVPIAPAENDFDRLDALNALLPFDGRGVPIVIRPHPSEDRSRLKRLVDSIGFSNTQWDESLATTLRRPAVIVCRSSTVALEAMIYHRPVVLATFSGRGDPTRLSREGAAIAAATPSDLTARVQSCLENQAVLASLDSARHRVLPQFLNGMDGCAAERLAAVVQARLPGTRRNASSQESPAERSFVGTEAGVGRAERR
jgi:hypothetical protein